MDTPGTICRSPLRLASALKCAIEGGEGAEELFARLVGQSGALVPVAAVEHAPPRSETAHAVNQWLTCRTTPDGDRGRGLYAACDVATGQVLLVEPALALLPMCKFVDDAEATRWVVSAQDEADVREQPHRSYTFALVKRAAEHMGADVFLAILTAYHPALAEHRPADIEAAPDEVAVSEAAAIAAETRVSEEDAAALLRIVNRTLFEMVAGPSGLRYAAGLFPATALTNHSCLPNARWIHLRDRSVLYALGPIAHGQEVTASYVGVLGSALTKPRHFSARRNLIHHTGGFVCRCRLCLSHEDHPDVAQPWGEPAVHKRYALVQRMCYVDESMPLESKLRVLASFLGTKKQPDARCDGDEPLDDFVRMAFLQWHLYFSRAAVHDRPAHDAHLPVALSMVPRLLAVATPAADDDQATTAFKLDTFGFVCYGGVRTCCRARHPAAMSIARQFIEFAADLPMPAELCALYLASGALLDVTGSAFARVCGALLHPGQTEEDGYDRDAVAAPPRVVPDSKRGKSDDSVPICFPPPLCD